MKKEMPVFDVESMRISFSGVSMFWKCPRQYYFRYVLGKKEIPGIALLEGSSHHESLKENNINKRDKGRDLKPKQLTDIFMGDLRARVEKEGRVDWKDEDEDKIFERAKILHEIYVNDFAPKIKPKLVEERFEEEMNVDGVQFVLNGVGDLTQAKKLTDYKVISEKGMSFKKREIHSDPQLSIYSHAFKLASVENLCFVKKGNPEIVPLESTRSKAQIEWALKAVASVVAAIKEQKFPVCAPTSWWCSPLYCGYWKFCRGKIER